MDGHHHAVGGALGAAAPGGLYRPRDPRASPLWQCTTRHAEELRRAGRIRRPVEEQVIERFIQCGDPHHGFARIRCDACGHDYLLPFSCKTRCFCPSCHQKRVLLYGEWVEEEVLEPVPHRRQAGPHAPLSRPGPLYRVRPLPHDRGSHVAPEDADGLDHDRDHRRHRRLVVRALL
jgi:transposase-like zinc-binding protein